MLTVFPRQRNTKYRTNSEKADFLQQVLVPAGTRLQRSRAAAVHQWGRNRGGAEQFELLERIPVKNFGEGVPLK